MATLSIPQAGPGGKLPGESAGLPGGAQPTGPQAIQMSTYTFIAGWILLIAILTMANKTRLGHVVIYYSLLLMILFILVTEYQQVSVMLNSVTVIGDLNQ